MSITVNILYSGEGDSARNFAKEMLESGLVEKIRAQEGNERYDYFFPLEDTTSVLLIDRWRNEEAIDIHHQSEMMEEIARLRKKYKLRLKVEKFQEIK
ncbi:antibiotic biosynthesis monooxygenase [Enterococcus villorum]|jgi:quinol monooxygenase YgiN|uniref:Antibiotic biosynthesis monooxygenase n=2 Tax=Enterococcus villorum TaxID=112904 RepID=A0A1V8YJY2_9ENTE|nr:antibiotic biosynthesis monooxygenase [Enterococcus villorum]EOH89673.1 antibiotic biosynthesis monooxygenase [Enterococcus villorum ATCC 700913]EOW78344.1 antibiotic biosynthesis monooxygenase [Enterococcus villorum ATCC 700913]OQO68064.1 antibiotic biosynthesis monooxygenase [Enterococcus villorum]OQO72923.1 antibiotic biosynthesis monooxygenase [Enterococcus villorum]GEL92864.1 antibiotic biosynthesis monooxygenase [Enterococcus villorum]